MTAILSFFVLLPIAILVSIGLTSMAGIMTILIVTGIGGLGLVLLGQMIESFNEEPAEVSQE
jgi:hypothetical protein